MSSGSITAITVRFYFVSLLAFSLFGTSLYLLVSALKRPGVLASLGILQRPVIQGEHAVGSECPSCLRFGSCARCDQSSSLRRHFVLKRLSNTLRHHHRKEASQRRSSGSDIEAQDDRKRISATEWAASLLRRIRSLERRNPREGELGTVLRQANTALATPAPTRAQVTHSPSVAIVETHTSHRPPIELPPLQFANEMDITDIVDFYTNPEDSFASVDSLETPRIAQHSIPDVTIHALREFAPPLQEIIRSQYLGPSPTLKESAPGSGSSPSCVVGNPPFPPKADAQQRSSLGNSAFAAHDMGDKANLDLKASVSVLGPFICRPPPLRVCHGVKVGSGDFVVTGTMEEGSPTLVARR